MGNDGMIAFRTREHLRKHMGMFSPQFGNRRWKMEFLGQMPFGIQAVRDALIIVDPADVQREYVEKMPCLAKVWDGSKGGGGDNLVYSLCMAIACGNGCRKTVPLMLRLWSSVHPEYVSEGDEVEQAIGQMASATNGRGMFVCDRGGDGDGMFAFYIGHGLDFIVRLVGDRHPLSWGGRMEKTKAPAADLARQCTPRYGDSVSFKSHNKVHNVRVKYGSMPVRLPEWPETDLHLVVVKRLGGEGPTMLLTTLNAVRTRNVCGRLCMGT